MNEINPILSFKLGARAASKAEREANQAIPGPLAKLKPDAYAAGINFSIGQRLAAGPQSQRGSLIVHGGDESVEERPTHIDDPEAVIPLGKFLRAAANRFRNAA